MIGPGGKLLIWRLVQTPLATNCYVLGCAETREAIVVDCGGEPDEVARLAEDERLRLVRLVATHGHADHIGGMARLRKLTGAPFAIHTGDAPMAAARQIGAVAFLGTIPPPVEADELLDGGRELHFGAQQLSVLHTPGHSPGGICLVGGGVLVSGDTLLPGSCGRTDLPGGDDRDLSRSLAQIAGLDRALLVLPGHGEPVGLAHELRSNPFLARE